MRWNWVSNGGIKSILSECVCELFLNWYTANIMSTQQPQRVRKIASPSMRPMKAVQPFTLKGSPTRKSPSSPNLWAPRRSPDFNYSPERKSPNSPNFRGKNISLNNVHRKMLAVGQFSRALSNVKFSAPFKIVVKIFYIK